MCAECGREERVYLAVREEIGAALCAGATLWKTKMGAGVAEAASGDARGCCRHEVGAGEHAAAR